MAKGSHQILEDEKESTDKQYDNKRRATHLAPWQYKKGQSGNPKGRKPGLSLKEYVRKKIETMNDKEREDFLHGLSKNDMWEMAEGKPTTKIDGELNVKVGKLEEIQKATQKLLDGQD